MHQDIDWSLAEADHVDFHGIWELDVDFQLVRLADADYPLMGCVRWSLACTDCVAVPIPIPIPIAPIVAVAMRRSIAIVFVCIIDYLFEEKLINI